MPFLGKFISDDEFLDHFENHGEEFEANDEHDYLAKAVAFLGGIKGATVVESIRRLDSATVRYNWVTQEYGIVSSTGFIITYFKPDPA